MWGHQAAFEGITLSGKTGGIVWREMTVTELARRIEVSIAYLSRFEREPENPPLDHLVSALARALDLPADDLFAAAHRLPPDMRARTQDVIAVYRQQTAGRD